MSVVAELQAPVEYLAIFERARAAVLSWEPSPVPARVVVVGALPRLTPRAVPGVPALVERLASVPTPLRGGRLCSLIPCVLAVALPWSAAIYLGRLVGP